MPNRQQGPKFFQAMSNQTHPFEGYRESSFTDGESSSCHFALQSICRITSGVLFDWLVESFHPKSHLDKVPVIDTAIVKQESSSLRCASVVSSMKFYVVRRDRIPGIYRNWRDCEEQVKKFRGCEYKSFRNYEEAKRYLQPDCANID
uniref:Ribonuclease H n=1 Tax=Physcomitrium patens TaxID=3218 RepID=A0A7I4AXT6_PHYPA